MLPQGKFGNTPYGLLDTRATGTLVAAERVALKSISIENNAAAVRYVKLYDKVSAPTSGDTPKFRFKLVANGSRDIAFPDAGAIFRSGLGIRCCTGVADNDNTDASANDVQVNLTFKSGGANAIV